MHKLKNTITDIDGILVGHAQDDQALTGCTVVIYKDGAIGGVDQRGGAPGTRETDLLQPMHQVHKVHAVLLTGGSAFGLDAATGVMRYLDEQNIGFNTGVAKIPIVPAAVLFDLAIGNPDIRPNAEMGYQACVNASEKIPAEGNSGAGTGASVGKIFGMKQAVKSGTGSASLDIGGGVIVGAIIAVNAFGDIINPENGQILTGARAIRKGPIALGSSDIYADTMAVMKKASGRLIFHLASLQNTVIGVVVTNARLTKVEANKVAQMAQNGLALTIRPAHSMLDGDTIFVLATNQKKSDVNIVGAFAAQVVASAIIRAIKSATPAGGLPSYSSLHNK